MRYSRKDLLQLKDYHLVFDEDITCDEDISKIFPRIRRLKEINVKGDGTYDPSSQRLYVHFILNGSVIVGCDITSEDVEVPIDTEADEIYTFDKNEQDISVIASQGEYIELLPTIFQLIMMDIPIKVVKEGNIEYPKGEGWEVVSEKTYQQQKNKTVDPRLSILKDYKPQDE